MSKPTPTPRSNGPTPPPGFRALRDDDFQASTARFFALSPDVLMVSDLEGRVRRVNPAVERILGYSESDFLSRSIFEMIDPADRPATLRCMGQIRSGERIDNFENRYHRPDGTIRRISWSVQPDLASGLVYSIGRDVTLARDEEAERARLDEARVAREAADHQYRMLTEAIPQIVWSARADGSADHFNARWFAYTGLGRQESLGWGWKPAIHPDDLASTVALWEEALRLGHPFEAEARLRRQADGADRWHLFRAEPVRDEGRLTGWFGTCTDIDDRRRDQEALRTQEVRFRTLSEAMPQIVWVARPNGYHEYFNGRWYEFTGMTPEASIGFGWSLPLHPDDVDRSKRRWRQATASGEPYEIEYRFRRRDGVYRWFLARAVPIRGASGSVDFWFGTCTDIDDQKRVAHQLDLARVEAERIAYDLHTSRERFRTLVEAVPQMVWSCRPDGYCDYLSRQWIEYTGVPLAEQIGHNWNMAIHPDDRDEAYHFWIEAAGSGRIFDHEYRLRGRDGAYRWFNARGVPTVAADGAILAWFGTSTDIDDRKRIDAEIRLLNRDLEGRVLARTAELEKANGDLKAFTLKLESSNRELQEFASVASHDLQEPLRKIQAFGDRLEAKSGPALGDEGRDYLGRMRAAAGRMRTLIDDLLAFSRVASKAQPFLPLDLARIAREVASDLEGRIAQTGGTVEVAPLPTIAADATQMRQLFQNLIGNGLKFHRPGVPPIIRVGCRPLPAEDGPRPGVGFVELTFEDNGIGFELKYLDRIFNVFQRLHGRDEYEGTGMGLAIVRKIVERHSGTITARSEPGSGATFVVALPVEHAEASEDSP